MITSKDFEAIEEVLEAAAIEKNIHVEEEELKSLKEDVTEYREVGKGTFYILHSKGTTLISLFPVTSKTFHFVIPHNSVF